jgi:hypothetical protein
MWKVMWITENTLVWVEDEYIGLNFDLTQDYAKQQASFTAPSGETHNLFLRRIWSQRLYRPKRPTFSGMQ